MMSGKSDLCPRPSWDDQDPTTCPRCNEDPESFQHAILSCPERESARVCHLQGVFDLRPDAPPGSSAALLGALSSFFRSTHTAFPQGMF